MRGPGSGNCCHRQARFTTDDPPSIDVRRWAREGMLRPGFRGGWTWSANGRPFASIDVRTEFDCVWLVSRHRGGGRDSKGEEHHVAVARTACRLGGSRCWFICPGCRRRIAILYRGATFACRHCHQLTYQSTRQDAGERAMRGADRIRLRLGWEPGILNGFGSKPRWMRWRTFQILVERHNKYVAEAMRAAAAKFEHLIPEN
jgi:hypothetical protein